MIEFQRILPKDKPVYERFFSDGIERGAELSFVNLCIWGEQSYAIVEGQFVVFAKFDGKCSYVFPVGDGDKKAAIERLIDDARERGIPFSLSGIYEQEKVWLENAFPDRFEFRSPDSFYDYVYDINDLADLAGKKYHRKRNHFRRFAAANDYAVSPIEEADLGRIRAFAKTWFAERTTEEGEFDWEIRALNTALQHREALGLFGMKLEVAGELIAFTFANRFSHDTMDVNFEKAAPIDGAYAAINCEFARYLRSLLPEIRFLNREEDMGIEGLRKAKENYFPHHRVIKYRAYLR